MTDKLKLAIVSDIHHGPTRGTKIGGNALELISAFIEEVNRGDFDMAIGLTI